MSKILIDIDTEKKTWSTKIDGKTLKNVKSIHAYESEYDDNKLRLNICTRTMSEDETIEEYNMISLAEEGLVRETIDADSFTGEIELVGSVNSDGIIEKSIASFVSSKLNKVS